MIDDILAASDVTLEQYRRNKTPLLRRVLCIAYLESIQAITLEQALLYQTEALHRQYQRETSNQ